MHIVGVEIMNGNQTNNNQNETMGSESESTHNENFSVQIQELSDQEENLTNLPSTEQGTYMLPHTPYSNTLKLMSLVLVLLIM